MTQRKVSAVPDKPAPVGLNLDTLTREGARLEPFVAVLDGRPYEFTDPVELDAWELRACMNDPLMLIKLAISAEDFVVFAQAKVPAWKLHALAEAWRKHYGVGEDAPGNGPASMG
jgi:hypothetical protein